MIKQSLNSPYAKMEMRLVLHSTITLYGNTTGTLNVFSGSKVVFSASGNKGNYWQKAERTIYLDKVVSHLSNIIVFFFNTLIIPGVNNSYLK